MTIRRSDKFYRNYKKLPKHIQKTTDRKLRFLLFDITHPSLRIKKYRKYKGLLELSITMQYRCLFKIEHDIYYLINIGLHDKILK